MSAQLQPGSRFRFSAPDWPASAVALRREVRAFLAEELRKGGFTPSSNCWLIYNAGFSARCGERGFLGLTLPREYGGHGRSPVDRYVVVEELLSAGAPMGLHWVADRQSGPQIAKHGSEALKRKVLPMITAGRCCFGIGMSEPGAGSDLAAVRTQAEPVEGGWKVNGSKLWTSHAHRANYIIALVRTTPPGEERRAGFSQFVIDMSSPGVRASPIEDLTGSRDFCEVHLDNVFVPHDHVLGKPGDGWKLVLGELSYERSGPDRFLSVFPLVKESLRAMQAAGEAGKPTVHATRALGSIATQLFALRQISICVAGMLERGESPEVEAALAKDLGNSLEQEIPDMIRALAPAGAAWAQDAALVAAQNYATLAAPSFSLRGGTREILRSIIARQLGLR